MCERQCVKASEGVCGGRAIVSQEKYWGQILRTVPPPLGAQKEKAVASGPGLMNVYAGTCHQFSLCPLSL